jgi:hypothetical protein
LNHNNQESRHLITLLLRQLLAKRNKKVGLFLRSSLMKLFQALLTNLTSGISTQSRTRSG